MLLQLKPGEDSLGRVYIDTTEGVGTHVLQQLRECSYLQVCSCSVSGQSDGLGVGDEALSALYPLHQGGAEAVAGLLFTAFHIRWS